MNLLSLTLLSLLQAGDHQLLVRGPGPVPVLVLRRHLPLLLDVLGTDAAAVVVEVAAGLADAVAGEPVPVPVLQVPVLPLLLVHPPSIVHTDGRVLAQGRHGVGLVETLVLEVRHVLVDGGELDVPAADVLDGLTLGRHLLGEDHVGAVVAVPVVVRLQAVVGVVVLQPTEQSGPEEKSGLCPDILPLVEEYKVFPPYLSEYKGRKVFT